MTQKSTFKILFSVLLISLFTIAKTQDITALYLVGDATPAGWNISNPTPMTQDAVNANLFTWEGDLITGELKFSTFTGDWCDGDWLLALEIDQSISIGDYSIFTGCAPAEADFKWRVTEGEVGTYVITIDLENETIVFELQEEVGFENSEFSTISVYPNPVKEYVTIDLGDQASGSLTVFSVDGRAVFHSALNESRTIINSNEFNASGLLFLRISTDHSSETIKVLVD